METLSFLWDMFVLLLSSAAIVALVVAVIQLFARSDASLSGSRSPAWPGCSLLWTSIADKYDVIRNGIGSFTLLVLRVVATAIFIAVTLTSAARRLAAAIGACRAGFAAPHRAHATAIHAPFPAKLASDPFRISQWMASIVIQTRGLIV